jgi:hypothetical protein
MILITGAFSSAGTASRIATPPVTQKIAASKADFMWVNTPKAHRANCVVPVLSEPGVLSPLSLLRKLRGEVLEKFQAQSGDAIRASRSRCQRHRKRESRHDVIGCKTLRSRFAFVANTATESSFIVRADEKLNAFMELEISDPASFDRRAQPPRCKSPEERERGSRAGSWKCAPV